MPNRLNLIAAFCKLSIPVNHNSKRDAVCAAQLNMETPPPSQSLAHPLAYVNQSVYEKREEHFVSIVQNLIATRPRLKALRRPAAPASANFSRGLLTRSPYDCIQTASGTRYRSQPPWKRFSHSLSPLDTAQALLTVQILHILAVVSAKTALSTIACNHLRKNAKRSQFPRASAQCHNRNVTCRMGSRPACGEESPVSTGQRAG